jgi:hypothetical protein
MDQRTAEERSESARQARLTDRVNYMASELGPLDQIADYLDQARHCLETNNYGQARGLVTMSHERLLAFLRRHGPDPDA